MGKNFSHEDSPSAVIDFCNQPITVSLNVEDCILFYAIGGRQAKPHVIERLPERPLCNTEPDIEGRPNISMLASGLNEFLSADYMHVNWKIHHSQPNYGTDGYNGE